MSIRHPRQDANSDPKGAKLAVLNAKQSLIVARSRTRLVDDLSHRLKIEGTQNHFIQRLNMHKEKGTR